MDQIPEVAKSFVDHCPKCDQERYHRVLSKTDENSAKIECEICGKKRTFKLKKEKPKKTGTRSPRKPQVAGGEWRAKLEELANEPARKYTIKEKFSANDKLEHPKFGVGVVMSVAGDRITTLFEAGEKILLHIQK